MQVLPSNSSLQKIILQDGPAGTALELTLGQTINARVLRIATDGQFLLESGSQRFFARSDLALTPGDEIALKVSNVGPSIELQLLPDTSQATAETNAIAALLQATVHSTNDTPAFKAAELLSALQKILQAQPSALSPTYTGPLSRLLLPLSIGPDADELMASLKNHLENSGIFFESKLRMLLENLENSSSPSLETLRGDLKTLLGLLSETRAPTEKPHFGGGQTMSGVPSATVSRHHLPEQSSAEDVVAQSKNELLEQKEALAQQLLSRQALAAFHSLVHGSFQTQLALLFGDQQTESKVRFFKDSSQEKKRGGGSIPLGISIQLDLPATGKLEASAQWHGSHIQGTLIVRDAEAQALFQSHVDELKTRLEATGFDQVLLRITVDPVHLYQTRSDTTVSTVGMNRSLLNLKA